MAGQTKKDASKIHYQRIRTTKDNKEKHAEERRKAMAERIARDYGEEFPKMLKQIREEFFKLTMEALASLLGISRNHVAKMETGLAPMGKSVMFLFFDKLERTLQSRSQEWTDLSDDWLLMIPDSYKETRGWEKVEPTVDSEGHDYSIPGFEPPILNVAMMDEGNEMRIMRMWLKGVTWERSEISPPFRSYPESEVDQHKKKSKARMLTDLAQERTKGRVDNPKWIAAALNRLDEVGEKIHNLELDAASKDSEIDVLKAKLEAKQELITELREHIQYMKTFSISGMHETPISTKSLKKEK